MISFPSIVPVLLCLLHIISNGGAFTVSISCVQRYRLEQLQLSSHLNSEEDVQIYPISTLDSSPSLVPDIAYYYLKNTIGLSEETMWKITLDAGSVLGMTPRTLEKKISLLRRTMDLSDEDVREILDKQPAVLHLSADRNLAPTILLLVRALDLSKSELRSIIKACTSILGYSMENLKRKLAFFTDTLGYSTGDQDDGKEIVRNMFLEEPRLLLCGVKSGLMARMKFLHNEIKFPLKDLRILYQKSPKLLLYSLDNNLREKIVFFFILQLQMELEHVRKLLMTYPQLMDYGLENHMKPIAEYFVTELDFSAIELRSIILRFPRLFTHSLFKVKHVVGFLRYELALDAQQVKRVVFQAPQIIGLDTEGNLKKKLAFLQHRIGLTQEELAMFIAKMPTIFNLNIETSLIPKFEYLEMNMSIDVLKEVLLKQPVLLGYSLNRTQTRMEELLDAGISPNKISVGISMTNARFHQWVISSQTRLKMPKWKSTVVAYLCNNVEFTNEDVESLFTRVPNIPTSAMQLQSQVSYLKQVFGTHDIKSLILEYPQLVDRCSKAELRRRIKELNLLELPLRDNIDRLVCDNEEFDKWIEPIVQKARSNIRFITERLELNDTEARVILSHFPEIESTPNWKSVRLKLNLLLAEWNSEKVKTLLLNSPEIIGIGILRLKHRLDEMRQYMSALNITAIARLLQMSAPEFTGCLERMKLLTGYGRPSSQINSIIHESPAAAEEHVSKLYLCKRLGCKNHEADIVLGATTTKQPILTETMQKVEYLLSNAFRNSTEDLKQALLVHPELLRKSLKNAIVPKVDTLQNLRSFGLEYTPVEVGKLLSNAPVKCEHIIEKVHYLFDRAFDHSAEDLRAAILAYPELLQQSMNSTLVQRVDTLEYLRSTGFEYTPEEIGKLLSSTASKYEHYLVPVVKTWSPEEKIFKGVEDAIRASLHEYSPSLMFACSQDDNRETAQIVYWK